MEAPRISHCRRVAARAQRFGRSRRTVGGRGWFGKLHAARYQWQFAPRIIPHEYQQLDAAGESSQWMGCGKGGLEEFNNVGHNYNTALTSGIEWALISCSHPKRAGLALGASAYHFAAPADCHCDACGGHDRLMLAARLTSRKTQPSGRAPGWLGIVPSLETQPGHLQG